MPTARRPIRFTARIIVEIEDFDQVAQTLGDSLAQAVKNAIPPSRVPTLASPPPPPPLVREPVQIKPAPVAQETVEENLLLDTKQVAKLLNIGERTLWRYWNSGRVLKPIKIGGAVRWRANELHEWIDVGCPTAEKWAKMKR